MLAGVAAPKVVIGAAEQPPTANDDGSGSDSDAEPERVIAYLTQVCRTRVPDVPGARAALITVALNGVAVAPRCTRTGRTGQCGDLHRAAGVGATRPGR